MGTAEEKNKPGVEKPNAAASPDAAHLDTEAAAFKKRPVCQGDLKQRCKKVKIVSDPPESPPPPDHQGDEHEEERKRTVIMIVCNNDGEHLQEQPSLSCYTAAKRNIYIAQKKFIVEP